jgi:predicted Zn-dependent peptidase
MRHLKYIAILFAVIISIQGSTQDYKLPPYEKFKLKNGLTVYLMEQHEVPLMNVSIILPAGAIYDGDKAGLV